MCTNCQCRSEVDDSQEQNSLFVFYCTGCGWTNYYCLDEFISVCPSCKQKTTHIDKGHRAIDDIQTV